MGEPSRSPTITNGQPDGSKPASRLALKPAGSCRDSTDAAVVPVVAGNVGAITDASGGFAGKMRRPAPAPTCGGPGRALTIAGGGLGSQRRFRCLGLGQHGWAIAE